MIPTKDDYKSQVDHLKAVIEKMIRAIDDKKTGDMGSQYMYLRQCSRMYWEEKMLTDIKDIAEKGLLDVTF